MYKSIIIPLCITFTLFMVLIFINTPSNLNASNKANNEIKSQISTTELKIKSFRRGTALGIELAVNEWLKSHPEVHIYLIQSHSTTLGTKILYIWYK